MGSSLYTGDIQFHLAKSQFNNALHALVGAAETYDGIETGRADQIVAYIANTIYTNAPIEKQLAEVINLFDWEVTFSDEGDIRGMSLVYDDSSSPDDEEALFTLLGPYVTQGSFIELECEQYGNRYEYRYVFTGTRMLEQEAHYDPVPDEREKGVEG